MHPHDPDRATAGSGGASQDRAANSRQFTMPSQRPGYGRVVVLIGFVAIAGLIGQSLFRRWRWTETQTGRIEVTVKPDDATISLDGGPPQRSPATVIVRAGPHRLTVERDGYAKVAQQFDVNPGETVELPVSLMAIPPPPAITRPAPARPSPSPSPSPSHAHRAKPHAVRANGVVYVDMKKRELR